MENEAKCIHVDSHSKTHSKNTSLQASKMQNTSSERQEQLLKSMIRKRTECKENALKGSSISAHNQVGKELSKAVRKGIEKLNTKESKLKSSTHSKMCFCAPTTHEGSFRCRFHRISAVKKPATENKSNLRCSSKRANGIVEFKPQLSRFGRIASAEVGSRGMESV